MRLDEVAGQKFGIILPAGPDSIDAGDWHGSSEVHTNKSAFIKAVKGYFTRYIEDSGDVSGERFEQIKKAKTLEELAEMFDEDWESFLSNVWIDDRF